MRGLTVVRYGLVGLALLSVKALAAEEGAEAPPADIVSGEPAGSADAAAPQGLSVADGESRAIRVPRVSKPPKLQDFIDGRPSELAHVTGFRQYEPHDGEPVTQKTDAYLGYDAKNLYVVFLCKSPPGEISAHLTPRDEFAFINNLRNDDFVSLNIDTFLDHRRAMMFVTNPYGVQWDGIYTAGRGSDVTFDTVWDSEGRTLPDGYAVRMAIPFRSLRFKAAQEQTWGIALGRVIVARNEAAFWPYITQKVESLVQQCASLTGIRGVSSGRHLEVDGYGLVLGAQSLDDAVARGLHYVRSDNRTVGLDAKMVLHDSVTLDATVHPDFSQVDLDDPKVLVNQRFEVFFPEKRPFFLENRGFFESDEARGNLTLVELLPQKNVAFFSRRIVAPDNGLRLTGKLGAWTFGSLATEDRGAHIGVGRLQREIGEQSTVGALATTYSLGDRTERVMSVDTRIKLSPNWVFNGQALASSATDFDRTHRWGSQLSGEIFRSGLHFYTDLRYTDISPGFRSSLSFNPRVDVRQLDSYSYYFWRPQHGAVTAFGPLVSAMANWDHEGVLEDWKLSPGFYLNLPRQTQIGVRHAEVFERYLERDYRRGTTTVSIDSLVWPWLPITGSIEWGRKLNYAPAEGIVPFVGRSLDAQLGLTVRPASNVSFAETYLYSGLGTRSGQAPFPVEDPTFVFRNHIWRSKIRYQVSRELSLRTIVDYNQVFTNESLFVVGPQKTLTIDGLATYLLHPGTALYAGFNTGYANYARDPEDPEALQTTTTLSARTGWQFFFKLTYLFRP